MTYLHRCGLAAALIALPGAAAAETPPTVETVIVTARPDPEDPPVVADARTRLSETPGGVAVVSAESLERRYAQGLNEVLRDVAGVFAQKRFGEDARLAIRGSGIGNAVHNRGVLLAQDGVPFNEADGAGDFQLLDPLLARYVEVYKGGNALRFGAAALGGAVNYVTPTGRTAQGLGLRLDGGAWGTLRGHAEVGVAGPDADVFLGATAITANGWRAQSDQTAAHLAASFGRTIGEDGEVRLTVTGHNVEQEIPGALTLAQALNSPEMATPASLAGEYQRNVRSVRAVVQARWRIAPDATVETAAYAAWKDLDHPIFQVIDQESRNHGAYVRLDWEGRLGERRADLFAGALLRQGDLDARQWVNRSGSRGALTAQSRQNAREAHLFAEGRLFVTDQLALVAGGALARAERKYENLRVPGDLRSKTFDWAAPRVGLLWEGDGGVQAFANLTRSVEPPPFSALAQAGPFPGFAPLEPQSAWTLEAGTRGRKGRAVWDVVAYRAEVEDELLNFQVGPDIPVATFNAGPTIHQGLEAALDLTLGRGWRLRQTYAWSDFRFDGDRIYGDARLPVVPEHLYRAELRWEHPAGWWLAPNLEWVPRGAFVDYANTMRAPGYAVVGLGGGWTRPDGLTVFLEARNLADERYVSNFNAVTDASRPGVSTAVFFPGEGRALFGGVSWRR
ncbi:TonB-dependent receptor family protein [Phenylobacterium terrae]|uniref:TonB-dependent receptor family protein n=1 Tax=Phenylobacterium terrae TaxID=2665495 RepID=A0ABW4MZK7_9CAUL